MVDTNVFSKYKSFNDFQKEAQQQQLANQLAQAQIRKLQEFDVDKLGEMSIYKALQGGQLTPQEEAAARFVNAKTGGMQFDPTTGNVVQKPNMASTLGLNLGGGQAPSTIPAGANSIVPPGATYAPPPEQPALPPVPFELYPANEYDMEFQKVYQGLVNNPKAQQQALIDYSKDKFNQNESQTKAAGFADRMAISDPVVSDANVTKELGNPWERAKDAIPIVGNYLTSDQYKQGNQAQRDFINAALRRESGAVINPDEFANARQQYFPQPGDDPKTLAQKAANRKAVIEGIQRSAGAAYKKPAVAKPALTDAIDANEAPLAIPSLYQKGEAEFNARKAKTAPKQQIKFLGFE